MVQAWPLSSVPHPGQIFTWAARKVITTWPYAGMGITQPPAPHKPSHSGGLGACPHPATTGSGLEHHGWSRSI